MEKKLNDTNALASNPDLFSQWHPTKNADLDPKSIFLTNSKKVWWLCDLGHEWEALVSNRARGSGCPFCSGNRILAGFNDLATLRPDVAATWSDRNGELLPSQVGANSHAKAWWKEPCGHEFEMQISQRTRRKLSCKICSGHELSVGNNDLGSSNPELIKEWDFEKNVGLKPEMFQRGSADEVWWMGSDCKHSWKAKISSRTRKQPSGCPVCKNSKVLVGVNDLATTFPDVAKEFDYEVDQDFSPQKVVAGSEKLLSWVCGKGHKYQATPYSRTVRKSGCPFCQNLKISVGENDFESRFPEVAKEWDYTKNSTIPSAYSYGSHSKAWFICPNKHSYQTVIRKRVEGNGCPYCGRKSVLSGFNDLLTEYPEIAKEWDTALNGKSPDQVMSGSLSRAWFKCDLGHSYKTLIQSKTRGGTGCPVCGNFQLLVGFNDLATRSPEVAAEWHTSKNGVKTPKDFVFGSHSYAWWICYQGHEWRSAINGRQKSGCPSCAEYGFKPHKPAIFYFIESESLSARKIGITNFEDRNVRLSAFKKRGWTEILLVDSQQGESILSLEKSMLTWIRKDLAMPVYLTSAEMGRQGGWTETFSAEGISNQKILDRISSELKRLGLQK